MQHEKEVFEPDVLVLVSKPENAGRTLPWNPRPYFTWPTGPRVPPLPTSHTSPRYTLASQVSVQLVRDGGGSVF